MQNPLGIATVLSVVVGAGVGAAVTSGLQRGSAQEMQTLDETVQKQKEQIAALQAELQRQQAAIQKAAREIQAVSIGQAAAEEALRGTAAAPPGAPEGNGSPAAAFQAAEASGGTAAPLPAPIRSALQTQVQSLVDEEFKRRDAEREEQRRQREERGMNQMLEGRLERVSEAVGLNDFQKGELKKVFDQAAEKFRALREQAEQQGGPGPAGFMQFRDQFIKIRNESNEAAKSFMTPEQHQSYLKWQDENDPRWFQGGGAPRGGSGGGNR